MLRIIINQSINQPTQPKMDTGINSTTNLAAITIIKQGFKRKWNITEQ